MIWVLDDYNPMGIKGLWKQMQNDMLHSDHIA